MDLFNGLRSELNINANVFIPNYGGYGREESIHSKNSTSKNNTKRKNKASKKKKPIVVGNRLILNPVYHNGELLYPIREITCDAEVAEDSGLARVASQHRGLHESISNMILVGPKYEGDEEWLPLDVSQRLHGHFYRGTTLNKARHVVECIIQMGSADDMSRKRCATLLILLCKSLKISCDGKKFTDIVLDYVLMDYTDHITFITTNKFPGKAYDVVLLYAELFVCFMNCKRRRSKGLLNKTKRFLLCMAVNKTRSLHCIYEILKIACAELYNGERIFGLKLTRMEHIFDKIESILYSDEVKDSHTMILLKNIMDMKREQITVNRYIHIVEADQDFDIQDSISVIKEASMMNVQGIAGDIDNDIDIRPVKRCIGRKKCRSKILYCHKSGDNASKTRNPSDENVKDVKESKTGGNERDLNDGKCGIVGVSGVNSMGVFTVNCDDLIGGDSDLNMLNAMSTCSIQ